MMNWFKKQPSEKELLRIKLEALEEETELLRLKKLVLIQERYLVDRKAEIERMQNE